MTDEEIKAQSGVIFDPTKAVQYSNEYLNTHPIAPDDTYVSRLSSMYPAPKPYTPQQEQGTRNAASMAETLKSLAEIYGQSKGAFLKQRQPEENIKADANILREKNKYDTDLREYSRAMIQAGGQDSERARQLKERAENWGQSINDKEYSAKLSAEQRAKQEAQYKDSISHRDSQAAQQQKNFETSRQDRKDESAANRAVQYSKIANSGRTRSGREQVEFDARFAKAITDKTFRKYLIDTGVLVENADNGTMIKNPLMPSNSREDIMQMYDEWLQSQATVYQPKAGEYRAEKDGVGYKKGDWVAPKKATQQKTQSNTTSSSNNYQLNGVQSR